MDIDYQVGEVELSINQQLERSEKSLHLPMRTECYYLRSEKIQSAIRNILDFYRFDLTN